MNFWAVSVSVQFVTLPTSLDLQCTYLVCERGSNRALPKGKLWLPELLTYCKCLSSKAKLWIHIQHFCSTDKRFLVHHEDEKLFSVKREIARGVRRHVAVTQTVTQTLIPIIWQLNSAYLDCLILYNLPFYHKKTQSFMFFKSCISIFL